MAPYVGTVTTLTTAGVPVDPDEVEVEVEVDAVDEVVLPPELQAAARRARAPRALKLRALCRRRRHPARPIVFASLRPLVMAIIVLPSLLSLRICLL